jgi:phenylpropionate dioxygenase-like ring-hydroxylating dioxygenase large terminal subunit
MSATSDARIDATLDEVMASLAEGLLPASVIADEQLFHREKERIFSRAWQFVGHESEIPARGDYVHRYLGDDAFVLVRGEDGEIRLLFDSCRHRGALICRAEKGNASHFRCSYHGWTYKNTGELTGAPLYQRAYGNMDKGQWGLFAAPHLYNLHGFIFASADPEAPPFEEYLGEMKWYLDQQWGMFKDGAGFEVVGEPQRWVLDSNWKTAAENFSGDDYHTLYLHRSVAEMGLLGEEEDAAGMEGTHIQTGNGHSISQFYLPPGIPDAPSFWFWPNAGGFQPEGEQLFEPRLGPEMYQAASQTIGNVGLVFPNFLFLSFPLQQVVATGPLPTYMVRTVIPRSPAELEFVNWILVPKGLTEEQKLASYRACMGTFGSSGIFDQDDTEPWNAITRTSRGQFARKVGMRLNYQMGMEVLGGDSQRRGEDWHPGPGVKYQPGLEEGVMRGFWRRWAQFLRSGGYPARMSPEEQNGGVAETRA